ncbi:hypothetical protein K474DRAFT_143259 [Panus rudis PR-1116 ss-1]|nr:hypothetical protein K474DRAFT_143259 [Panus rudis PR-1116 ss-1]
MVGARTPPGMVDSRVPASLWLAMGLVVEATLSPETPVTQAEGPCTTAVQPLSTLLERVSLIPPSSHPLVKILNDVVRVDHAGNGGTSVSGNAYGGHAKRGYNYTPYIPTFAKGGNAKSGDSGNANGGDVVNEGGYIWNGWGSNTAGDGGFTGTGIAKGGNGLGGGGNAVSGNSGNANGGSVYNGGGTIINTAGANHAGNGGVSVSGTAIGGNAH